jgi:hypothetical protein
VSAHGGGGGGVESPAHLLAIESHVPLAAGVRLVPAGLVRQYVFNNRYSRMDFQWHGAAHARRLVCSWRASCTCMQVAGSGPRSAVSALECYGRESVSGSSSLAPGLLELLRHCRLVEREAVRGGRRDPVYD